MDRVHLEYFGPFWGKKCLLMVDSFSGWGEVNVVPCTDSMNTINVLRNWVFRYALPNQLVSDNGTQFTSHEFKQICKSNGINHILTPRYHQSSNGEAERLVQTVKRD